MDELVGKFKFLSLFPQYFKVYMLVNVIRGTTRRPIKDHKETTRERVRARIIQVGA